jgi:tyrosinase
MPPNVRVRRSVAQLAGGGANAPAGDWDPILTWYAKAMTAMLARSIDDPTSWGYQAAIHGFDAGTTPLKPGEHALPTNEGDPWGQCQHGGWYFLPWHRMYLAYFERIVATTIAGLGGPADWALPYWNYCDSANADALKLPFAFRSPTLHDGSPNPLRIPQRVRGNSGKIVAPASAVAYHLFLLAPRFVGGDTGPDLGFGGPPTDWHHPPGAAGEVENVPHNLIHSQISGFMGDFNTAALDPIFWLHHCNIDRMWAIWRKRAASNTNPDQPTWLTKLSFAWQDGSGNQVTLTPSQVVDTTAPPMSYDYDDTKDPLAAAPPAPALVARSLEAMEPVPPPPEMVGATGNPVELSDQTVTVDIDLSQPTGPARAAAGGVPKHAFLELENITGGRTHLNYTVYLNLPANVDPAQHPEYSAGVLSTFGVAEASRPSTAHPGSGLRYRLSVGGLLSRLHAANAWDPHKVRVTFAPMGPEPDEPEPGFESLRVTAPVQIGRISLHYT